METFLFLPFVFLAMLSVSSTQAWKTNVFKSQRGPEPTLTLGRNNEASHPGGQRKAIKQGGGHRQENTGAFLLHGAPGYAHQPGKMWNFNQQGRPGAFNQPESLQGVSGESKQGGKLESSDQQGTPGSSSQQGKLGSSSQQGKPGSSSQQGKPGSSSQQGKPGSSSQQGKPGSNQQGKPRSFYNQERKNISNAWNGNTKETEADSTSNKSPVGKSKCQSIYQPVCGSDGKTYGNSCIFNEAKRLSRGKLILRHEGKC